MKGVTMKKGSLIHTEKPFVHVLSSKHKDLRCDHCFSGAYMPFLHKVLFGEYSLAGMPLSFIKRDLLRCSNCRFVRYCDRSCQKHAWNDHKNECEILKNIPPHKEFPSLARLIARILFKLKRGGNNEKGFYPNNRFRVFQDLMTHYSSIKDTPKKLEHAGSLYYLLNDLLAPEFMISYPEFVSLYGRVSVNSFNILDNDLSELGTGIYLGASTIDHSCNPNAIAVFTGTTINIRTVVDIEDYNWDKVRISYIETLQGREDRIAALESQYFFTCDCDKCLKNNEYVENVLSCQECSNPVDRDMKIPTCSNCGWRATESAIQLYDDAIEFAKHQIDNMQGVAYLDACELSLKKMDGIVHPNHILYVKMIDLAFESAINLQLFDKATIFGQRLISGFRLYYGLYNPVVGYHYLKYAKLLIASHKFTSSHDTLETAQEILKITHGTEHPLYRYELYNLMYRNDN